MTLRAVACTPGVLVVDPAPAYPQRRQPDGPRVTLRKLEKYDIEEELGHGGMATVYRARDTRLDRAVAVKVMHPHLRGAHEARARFSREARTVARLRHPNILEIYDYSGEDSPESFIATELLTGPTLKRFVEDHPPLPAEIAACFAWEIARALEAAHAQGVVHRDVKPENVLLHENRAIKLTDFGIAQMVDAQSMTATGQVLGSPGHMAPEQVEGRECDARADLFALGTVLFYLATGALPFTGRHPHAILKKIADGDYPDPLRLRPAVGARLAGILRRLLARDPADRHPDAAAVQAELAAFVAEIGIDDPSATLVAYLADPETIAATLRTQTIACLTARAEAALDRGEPQHAAPDLDRVLALDDGNARALALLSRASRRARLRRVGLHAAIVVLALSGIGMGTAALRLSSGAREVADARTAVDTRGQATDGRIPSDSGLPASPLRTDTPGVFLDAGIRDDPASEAGPVAAPASAPLRAPARFVRVSTEVVAPSPSGPDLRTRRVVFAPSPVDVTISVDGRSPRPFGPSYAGDTLAVGAHEFVFANDVCCVESRFAMLVPPGDEPLRVARALELKPARLFVRAVGIEGARVAVDGQPVGPAWSLLSVPVRALAPRVTITVTAEGHPAYTRAVQLEAGRSTEVTVASPGESGSAP
jgi:serine/threonine-protein kinase